jgi:uncharacterized membrane protein
VEHILPRQNRHAPDELRWLFGLGGAALLIWGWRRRSWQGVALSSAGVDLLNWSCTGHYLHETLGFPGLTSKGLRALVPHQLGIRVGEEPETQIKQDLRRLKQILEAGEIAST